MKHKGVAPGALSKHSAVAFNGKMYIYGGIKANGQTSDCLYVFDSQVTKWSSRPRTVSLSPSLPNLD